eukprot:Nk52_evm1s562 gene=Nk52_evmTU1s562
MKNIRQLSPNRCHSIVMAAALVLFATWATMLPPVNAKPSEEKYFYKIEALLHDGSLKCKLFTDKECRNLVLEVDSKVSFKKGNSYKVTNDQKVDAVYIEAIDTAQELIEWHYLVGSELFIDYFSGRKCKRGAPIKGLANGLSPLCSASRVSSL